MKEKAQPLCKDRICRACDHYLSWTAMEDNARGLIPKRQNHFLSWLPLKNIQDRNITILEAILTVNQHG